MEKRADAAAVDAGEDRADFEVPLEVGRAREISRAGEPRLGERDLHEITIGLGVGHRAGVDERGPLDLKRREDGDRGGPFVERDIVLRVAGMRAEDDGVVARAGGEGEGARADLERADLLGDESEVVVRMDRRRGAEDLSADGDARDRGREAGVRAAGVLRVLRVAEVREVAVLDAGDQAARHPIAADRDRADLRVVIGGREIQVVAAEDQRVLDSSADGDLADDEIGRRPRRQCLRLRRDLHRRVAEGVVGADDAPLHVEKAEVLGRADRRIAAEADGAGVHPRDDRSADADADDAADAPDISRLKRSRRTGGAAADEIAADRDRTEVAGLGENRAARLARRADERAGDRDARDRVAPDGAGELGTAADGNAANHIVADLHHAHLAAADDRAAESV